MPTVHLYRFLGTFRGKSEFDYTFPQPGATHEGLAFVRQDEDVRDDDAARAACRRHGFEDVEILRAGAIRPETLDQGGNAQFIPYVRLAFERGAALVWYEYPDQGSPSQ